MEKDARTGKIVYHNSDVDIEESIDKKFPLFLILIWSQKIDNGKIILAKVIK